MFIFYFFSMLAGYIYAYLDINFENYVTTKFCHYGYLLVIIYVNSHCIAFINVCLCNKSIVAMPGEAEQGGRLPLQFLQSLHKIIIFLHINMSWYHVCPPKF